MKRVKDWFYESKKSKPSKKTATYLRDPFQMIIEEELEGTKEIPEWLSEARQYENDCRPSASMFGRWADENEIIFS